MLTLILTSCNRTERSNCEKPKPLGYDFIIFDSDGDGVKDDVAQLICFGMTGGYGSFRLEVHVCCESGYVKIFDSEQDNIDSEEYEKLSGNVPEELMIDEIYSVESVDIDGDGSDELLCRRYAWIENHINYIGDVISVLDVSKEGGELIEIWFEPQK